MDVGDQGYDSREQQAWWAKPVTGRRGPVVPGQLQALQPPGRACYRLRTTPVVRGDMCPAPRVKERGVRLPGAAEGRARRGREPGAVLSCHALPAFVWPRCGHGAPPRCGRGAPPASGEGLYPAPPAPPLLPRRRPGAVRVSGWRGPL